MAGPGGDTPIVIADGSLTLESAVPWAEFTKSNGRLTHPHAGKSVAKVTVSLAGNQNSVPFSGQQCQVVVQYASTDITVATAGDGTGLHVLTDWSVFQPGEHAQQMKHAEEHQSIAHVSVQSGGQTVFDSDASGSTRVEISYR